jgi:catechol 2,3-dioxygenase-like lactoylglutathione lyase family enzyme
MILDRLQTITLFVEGLDATKAFYVDVFGLPVCFEDGDSAVRFGVQGQPQGLSLGCGIREIAK